MNPTEQLAHFSGGTNDLSMTGLWYSHKRVAQLVEAARAEAVADLRAEILTEVHRGMDDDGRNGARDALFNIGLLLQDQP